MSEHWSDDRGASRYEAVKSAVYLGWWEEPEFRTRAARLRNLSHLGALVQVASMPPTGTDLWLCLAGSRPGEWAEVRVVSFEPLAEGDVRLRLVFAESCPYEIFEGAVLGRDTSA